MALLAVNPISPDLFGSTGTRRASDFPPPTNNGGNGTSKPRFMSD